MGDINQTHYLMSRIAHVSGPILEVGSKDYGSTSSFREAFAGNEYVGVDLAEGKGVDVVHDLAQGVGPLQRGHFSLIVCCSVMEHTPTPWKLADTLTDLLAPGGTVYISVPWVWRYHPYPDDYFRFSHRGVMALFPDLTWSDLMYSTTVPGELLPIKDGADNAMASHQYTLRGKRKLLPYFMVNMLGRKQA